MSLEEELVILVLSLNDYADLSFRPQNIIQTL